MDCVFEINGEWYIFGQLEADIVPRIGEHLELYGSLPNDDGNDERQLLIGFEIEEVNYQIPPSHAESRDVTVDLYSGTRAGPSGQHRARDLVRDLLAEGWRVTGRGGKQVTNHESVPDVAVDRLGDD